LSTTSELKIPLFLRDPDVALMLRVKAGEEAAFVRLVEGYQDRLIGLFFQLVKDRAAAEDLTQETFLRVYRARHGYEPTAKFSTWLFHIAHNLASNKRRDKGRRREVNLVSSDSGPLGARPQEQLIQEKSGMMPSRQLDKSELQNVVQEALDGLNERQKMAVLLHKFQGMSYADVAETMELTPAAVKSLLSRARESLRGKLEPYVK
jgi:RNA polymerase sigma-70 factor (ECF subfamily)